MKFIRAASIDNSSSWQTAKLPEILNLIPSGFSLLFCFLCSITNHTNMLVMADESMTKQRCTIIQIKLWDICLYLCKMSSSTSAKPAMCHGIFWVRLRPLDPGHSPPLTPGSHVSFSPGQCCASPELGWPQLSKALKSHKSFILACH